jgi:hypothetical protein
MSLFIKDVEGGIFAGKNNNDEYGHYYSMSDLYVKKMADGGVMANGGLIKVGTFDEEQLKRGEDNKAVEGAIRSISALSMGGYELKYTDRKIINKDGKMYTEVYLVPNEYNITEEPNNLMYWKRQPSYKMSDGGMMEKGGNVDKIKFIYSIHKKDEYGDILPNSAKKMSVVRANQSTAKEVVYKKYPSKDYFVELEDSYAV